MSVLKKMCGELTDEDYTRNVMLDDLRLAAELGQTLLERNKELEISLQQHQNLVEDQAQKIEYLTKQTAALREVNNSRLRIYEQLEVSIQELERANHRLVLENSSEKKRIKTSNATVESLESKCEDLQSTIDDLKLQIDALKRKSLHDSDAESPTKTKVKTVEAEEKRDDFKGTDVLDCAGHVDTKSRCDSYPVPQSNVTTEQPKSVDSGYQNKEDSIETDSIVEQLLTELRKTRTQCTRDERRITELEEQLSTMVQQNQALENQVIELAHREEDLNVKSMHEELISLDEVRLGQTCSRCLRSIDYNSSSEVLDDDDVSIVEATPTLRSSFSMDVQDNHLEELLRREMSVSVMWISPAVNIFSVLVDLCLYVKDCYLVPYFARPLKIPFILLHYCLRHKLH